MNERIRQLAEQANIHFSRVGILDGDPNGSARMVGYSKMEKFAELIVQECVEICNQAILQNQDTLSKLNEHELHEKLVIRGSILQAQKLGNGINQYFGVGE